MASSFRASLAILFLFTLVSCDKAEKLRAEQAILQAKRVALMDQMAQIDAQLRALGPNGMASVPPAQKQASEMETKAAVLENTATDAIRKWSTLEKTTSSLQARADAWKAKYLK